MSRLRIPDYLTPIPRRQSARAKSQGRVCPNCQRVLLPTRQGCWPWHFKDKSGAREWCPTSNEEVRRRAD